MKSECKQYKVDIFGEQYALVSDEREEHVVQSAQLVDSLIKEIAAKLSGVDAKKAAVLVALQMASELIHLKNTVEGSQAKEADLAERMEKVIASL